MAVYDLNGNRSSAYALIGTDTDAYTIDGTKIYPDVDPYLPGRTLAFEDSFDGDSIDQLHWNIRDRIGNNGQLHYYRPDNSYIENGKLTFLAKKEEYGGRSWTSGLIESKNKMYWKYGRIEAKIKFPKVVGSFPAFWTMGNNDLRNPLCGEIDIVEIMPRSNPNMDRVYCNLWDCSKSSATSLGNSYCVSSTIDDWHIYSMEWTESYIAMLFDNVEYHRWTLSDYDEAVIERYHEPQYILLNLAVGGSGGTPSDDTTSMKMQVDWLRIYEPLE